MNEFWSQLVNFMSGEQIWIFIRVFVLIISGIFIAKLISASLKKFLSKKADAHYSLLFSRGSYYIILCLFLFSALHELGFNIGVLLGAAGILSVAIGFASQTSASNLISGLFLMIERPFIVGDIIRVGSTTGEVLSIDLLSVKLRTFDNLFVRIPNESLIKSEMTTLTRFPIRRLDIMIGIAYKEDLKKVREILNNVAAKNPLCLEEPKPIYIFLEFGESSINIQYSVWAKRENFLELKNSIQEEIKLAFDDNDIEIPFPHRTIYTGSITKPYPVKYVDNK